MKSRLSLGAASKAAVPARTVEMHGEGCMSFWLSLLWAPLRNARGCQKEAEH